MNEEITSDTLAIQAREEACRAHDRAALQTLVEQRKAPPTEKQRRAAEERERERITVEARYEGTDQARAARAREAREKDAREAAAEAERVRAAIEADPVAHYRGRVDAAKGELEAAEAALVPGDEATERAFIAASNALACARALLKVTEKRGNK